jgi:chromosome segregation ATPase
MALALSAVQAAFQLSGSALQNLGEPFKEQPEKSHSIWDYWPVATSGMTCLITTVNAVALGVIGNIPLGVLLGIAAVGAGILTIYLWSFSTLKDLEGYVEVFAERVTTLAQTALQLSASNKDLVKTRMALEAEVHERAAQFEKEKNEVSRVLQQLGHVSDDLQQSQSHVVQMGEILDSSHSVITEMTAKIGDFVHLNTKVSTSSQLLSSELSSIHAIGERLESAVQGLDKQNTELLSKKKQADEMTKGLYTQFVQIAELFVGLKKQREALEENLHSLQKVDTSLATHTTELHHVAEDLEKRASSTQALVDWIQQYEGIGDYIKEQMETSAPAPK